ncbi:hypothetical protein [Hyphomonas sediminis]|uniref:hypothetical protein n=1 Tax=Hyphomonas sediminis TaxID=2866160 RepID=UPI0034E1DF88
MPGYCVVRFNLDTRGRPSIIFPSCSHPVFCSSAAAAIEASRFMPARRDGKIVARTNIVYPLEYKFYGMPDIDWSQYQLEDCVDALIS